MVENDAVNVSAYVRIYKDPTGVLWHNFIKSVPLYLSSTIATNYSKLQFQKGDWDGRSQESRGYLLSQFVTPIVIFHEFFSKGMMQSS